MGVSDFFDPAYDYEHLDPHDFAQNADDTDDFRDDLFLVTEERIRNTAKALRQLLETACV